MKYWVYKDSRILGPFDKNDVSGLPGLDASTLVCAGESATAAEGDWRPAGDVADLAGLPLDRSASWPIEDLDSTHGLLDKFSLDAAGLIGDHDFPGAAEDLFQDAHMKRTFGDLITPRPSIDEAELRRAKDRASELTVQLELLYKRVAELETGQTNLVRRLAEKEMLLRTRPMAPLDPPPSAPPPPAPAAAAPAQAAPTPVAPAPAAPPPAAPVPEAALAPLPVTPELPPLFAQSPAPAPASSSATSVPPPVVSAPAPSFAPVHRPWPPLATPAVPIAAAAPVPAPEPKKAFFAKKTFKIVPMVKSFRVVGAEDQPAAAASPAPAAVPVETPVVEAFAAAPPAPVVAPPAREAPSVSPATALEWGAPVAAPAPAPILLTPTSPAPTPAPAPETKPPVAAPPAAAPDAGSFVDPANAPLPSFGNSFSDGAHDAPLLPPSTAVFKGKNDIDGAPSSEEALARLAKPASGPATASPRAPRSNKPFLIGAAALVVVMAVVGAIFLRHPKDLKQMTELDDGRARVGAEPTDDASRPPLVKPQAAASPADAPAPAAPPAPAAAGAPAAEAPQAASQSKLDAAVAAVKDFPLDGDRGTVAQWLQFSYSAGPDAGKESWNASETSDKTYLVEYRFTPSARGEEVHYLFEVDMDRGFVIGKNLDAKSVLAGGPRAEAGKAKSKAKAKPKAAKRKAAARPKKKAAKRRAPRASEDVAPKDVPLLPLPNEEGLRPPAEDDGTFSSDTVNSGL